MMRGSRNSAFLFVLVACLPVSAFQSSTSYGQLPVLDFVVLTGATVIDGLGNPPLADATVIVEGDRSLSISVLNPPPSGGLSNSVSLMIQAEWHAQ